MVSRSIRRRLRSQSSAAAPTATVVATTTVADFMTVIGTTVLAKPVMAICAGARERCRAICQTFLEMPGARTVEAGKRRLNSLRPNYLLVK